LFIICSILNRISTPLGVDYIWDMTKVLCVCLGNICRSPMAQGVLQQCAAENGLDILVDSAGTAGYHVGEQPDHRSIAVANKFGLDISNQKARKITTSDFEKFNLILVMDAQNLKDVLQIAPNSKNQAKIELYRSDLKDVEDPYYGAEKDFINMYHVLIEHAPFWMNHIQLNS
jgi:protein-tyrosine phosphatase